MIVEPEVTVTASTVSVPLHGTNPLYGRQSLLLKNTSANAATVTVTGQVPGTGASVGGSVDYPLAASASLTVSGLALGETVTAKRSAASDATIVVQRYYTR